MTACTERRFGEMGFSVAGEGQKGMPRGHSMTACTERRFGEMGFSVAGEGQKGMPREAQHD